MIHIPKKTTVLKFYCHLRRIEANNFCVYNVEQIYYNNDRIT